MDLCALAAPIGLFFGRIANFIRPELWGRPTDVPWAVIFPGTDGLPRHPSQIYEALLEGALAFVVLLALARRGALKRPGLIAGAFGVLYGAARIFCEFFREPDPRLEDLGARADDGNGPVGAAHRHRARAARRKPEPEVRAEMTTLLDEIKALIARDGPITVERYMALALAHPEFGYYMNRDPVRRERRLHHRPGNLADVRRASRPVGGGSVGEHGFAEPCPPGRNRARPRHADERRAARGPDRAGIPRRARRLARRGEPDACRDPARAPARQRRRCRLGAEARRNSRRAGDRPRQ